MSDSQTACRSSICVPMTLEIEHYAALLDSLGIGLLSFAADGSVHLRNSRATDLLGDTPTIWEDENGQPLPTDERLEMQVLHTRQAVHQRAMGIRESLPRARSHLVQGQRLSGLRRRWQAAACSPDPRRPETARPRRRR
jgi:PAS domain-containing protein